MNFPKVYCKSFHQKFSPPFLLLALILFFFWEELFSFKKGFIGGLDVAEYFYWHAHFIREQILDGHMPLWNPYYYSGHPFLANPQTFILYPSTLFFVIFPLPWAFNLDTILHIYLSALGMYYFVHLLTFSKSAGIGAGVIYSMSGYFMDNVLGGHLTMIHTAALIPWIFYFFEKGFLSGKAVFFLISGSFFGLQILSGEPQNNFYTAFYLTLYFFTRIFTNTSNSRLLSLYRIGIYFLFIPVVGLGISMGQILPSLEFFSLSDRFKNTYDFVTFMSFPPQNFYTFLVPKPETPYIELNWEFGGYFSILGILLAGIGIVLTKKKNYIWSFLILLLIAFTMMLGEYTFFYKFYFDWLPGTSLFRVPARAMVIFVFAMGVFVGFGIKYLTDEKLTRRERRAIIIFILILMVIWWLGGKNYQVSMNSTEMIIAITLMFISFLLFKVIHLFKASHWISGVLIAIIFFDLYITYGNQTPILNQDKLLRPFSFEVTLQQDPGLYRIAVPKGQLRGLKFHYHGINGYTPIGFGPYFYFIHTMADLPIPQKRRQKLNPDLFFAETIFSSRILGIKYGIIQTGEGFKLVTNNQVIPRAILVKESVIIPQRENQIHRLKNPTFNPLQTVLLDALPPSWPNAISKNPLPLKMKENVKISHYSPNRIDLKSISNESRYLVLSELFYPGWKAWVDGKEVSILKANYLLRALFLPPGEHEIVFQYKPFSFYAGASISLATVLVLTAIGIFSTFKRREDLSR